MIKVGIEEGNIATNVSIYTSLKWTSLLEYVKRNQVAFP